MKELCFERLIRETDLEWLIETVEGVEVWLPKSECDLDGEENLAIMPKGLAVEKGLV